MYRMQHSPKKKVKKLSDAVFRGLRSLYTFAVYTIDSQLADQPGVYIFSRRITDRFGGGHHRIICIGQTDSLKSEIKKHNRSKVLKEYEANVLCLLREQDEDARIEAVADLKEAHSSVCIHERVKPIVRKKKNEKKISKPVASPVRAARVRGKRPKSRRAAA